MSPRGRERAESIIEKHVNPRIGDRRVASLQPIDIEEYFAARRKDHAQPATIRREWNTLRAILNFLEKYGGASPIRKKSVQLPTVEGGKLVFFEAEEWRSFIAAFDDEKHWRTYRASVRRLGPTKVGDRSSAERRFGGGMKVDSPASDEYLARLREFPAIFTALLFTGGRLNDVLAISWEDVDLKRAKLTLWQDKANNLAVTLPIATPLRTMLESLPRGAGKVRIFRHADGSPFSDREVQRAFAVARNIAKLRDDLTPHSLRHTFASWLVMKGTPLRTVQELLGHADIKTTMKYAHLSPSHMAGALDAIAEVASGDVSGTRVAGERV